MKSLRKEKAEAWVTADGQRFTAWRDANEHQKFLALHERVEYLLRCSVGAEAFTRALLKSPGFTLLYNHPKALP